MVLSEQGKAWTRKAMMFLGVLMLLASGAAIGDPVTVRDLARGVPAFIFLTSLIYLVG